MRQITITKAMNGYVVQVGCQTLVFETTENLLRELEAYLADPVSVEKRYVERYMIPLEVVMAVPPGTQSTSGAGR